MMPTTQTDRAELIAQWLPQICEALLRADPDILAVVQFGSSVYAPELALDLDLLVITKRKKDDGVYWNAVWSAGQTFLGGCRRRGTGRAVGFSERCRARLRAIGVRRRGSSAGGDERDACANF